MCDWCFGSSSKAHSSLSEVSAVQCSCCKLNAARRECSLLATRRECSLLATRACYSQGMLAARRETDRQDRQTAEHTVEHTVLTCISATGTTSNLSSHHSSSRTFFVCVLRELCSLIAFLNAPPSSLSIAYNEGKELELTQQRTDTNL